jgi:hypothetical protein
MGHLTIRGEKHGWCEPANLCGSRILVIYGEVYGFTFGEKPDWYQRCYIRIKSMLTNKVKYCIKRLPEAP